MNVQHGLVCQIESGTGRPCAVGYPVDGLCVLLFYAALWGGMCSMAALAGVGAAPLLPGGILALALTVAGQNRRLGTVLLAAGAILAAVLLLVRLQVWLDGVRLLLNRLFAASEARQAYVYEKFSVAAGEEAWLGCIQYALVPLGLITGLACGGAVRYRKKLLLAAIVLAFAGLAAYLGLSPEPVWMVLLAAALILTLREPLAGRTGSACLLGGAGSLAALGLVAALVLVFMPGEDTRLSAWDERARDILAFQTVAYDSQWRPTSPAEMPGSGEEKAFYREEETPGGLGGDEMEWTKPISAFLVILIFALLLFLPALLSDLLRKRRAKNRAGLDEPAHDASIRAMFRYTLRWLCLGGLRPANVPFSGYTLQIGALFSDELRAGYEAILPLWQEAAYSSHEMDETQRIQMRRFMEAASRAVWDGLDRRGRIMAKYIYAL